MSEAIPHLLRAVELSPKDTTARTNLCLVLSLADRPQEAIPHAQRAASRADDRKLVRELQSRLSSYEAEGSAPRRPR